LQAKVTRLEFYKNSIYRIHLDELATSVLNHPVLKTLPTTVDLVKRYNHAISVIAQYKIDISEVWTHQNSWIIEDCLKK
jgi:dynein heavy chain